MHWGILWLSLVASVFLALGFVKISLLLGLKDQLNFIVPLLPVFYAGIFPILEKTFSPKSKESKIKLSPEEFIARYKDTKRWSGKLTVILTAAAISLITQLAIDLVAWSLYRHFAEGLPLGTASFSFSAISRELHGDLVPLQGFWKFNYLWFEMFLISFCGGVFAGWYSTTNPLLNGVLAGVIVSMWTGAHQFMFVYEQLALLAMRLTAVFRFHPINGMVIAPFLQVFLFALWSGLAYRHRTAQSSIKIIMPSRATRR